MRRRRITIILIVGLLMTAGSIMLFLDINGSIIFYVGSILLVLAYLIKVIEKERSENVDLAHIMELDKASRSEERKHSINEIGKTLRSLSSELRNEIEQMNISVDEMSARSLFLTNSKFQTRSTRVDKDSSTLESTSRWSPHDYFDQIFLVNLKDAKKENYRSIYDLRKLGIHPLIWKATNGYKSKFVKEFKHYQERQLGNLHFEEYNDLEVKRGMGFIESPGAWGYIKTYTRILKYARENKFEKILILEDDLMFTSQFLIRLENFLAKIPRNWKIVQLGCSQYNWGSVDIADSLLRGYYSPRILDTCGSFAIGINQDVYDELLENLSHMEAPFDHLPMGMIYENYLGKCFVAFPNLIVPDVSYSTIRGERNQYKHSIRMKWPMDQVNFPIHPIHIQIVSDGLRIDPTQLPFSEINGFLDLSWIIIENTRLKPVHTSECIESVAQLHTPFEFFHLITSYGQSLSGDYVLIFDSSQSTEHVEFSSFFERLIEDDKAPMNECMVLRKHYSDGIVSYENTRSKDIYFVPSRGRKLVSVIIPTYKRSENIKYAVDSVLAQSYTDFEIIIVDDNGAGTDQQKRTQKTVDEFQNKDIRYLIHPHNLNGAAARNTGIFHSNGDYIAFLDDDDIYKEIKLESCLDRLLQLTDDYGGVYGGFEGWNSPSNNLERYPEGDLSLDLLTLDYKKHYLHTNTALYKKEALLRINGFDESFRRHQDLEMNLRFFNRYKIGSVKEIVAQLNPRPSSIDNRLFGKDLFEVKLKFLSSFEAKISQYSEEIQVEIYNSHWNEIRRYFNSESELFSFLEDQKYLSNTSNPFYFLYSEMTA